KMLTVLNQESSGDTLREWDLVQGKETRVLKLPVRRNQWSVFRRNALSRDGKLCAIHTPKEVLIFDIANGRAGGVSRPIWQFPHTDEVRVVVFAGDHRLVIADKKQQITVRDARTGKVLRQFDHGAPLGELVVSSDGARLATLRHNTHEPGGVP